MVIQAPIVVYLDTGLTATLYKIKKSESDNDYVEIWYVPFGLSIKKHKLKKLVHKRNVFHLRPTMLDVPGVPQQITYVYTNEDNSLITNIFGDLKTENEKLHQKSDRDNQRIAALTKQVEDLSGTSSKVVASMKKAVGTNERSNNNQPLFNSRFSGSGLGFNN
jgi:hypothetical protein